MTRRGRDPIRPDRCVRTHPGGAHAPRVFSVALADEAISAVPRALGPGGLTAKGLQQKARVRSTESEAIGKHGVQLREPRSRYDRHSSEFWVEFLDVDGRSYEAMLEHAYAKDRFERSRRAQGMTGHRFRR